SFIVNGPFIWQNSSVGLSGTLTTNGATAISATVQDQTLFKGGTLNNNGTLTQTGAFFLGAGNNTVINNLSGGTWKLQDAAGINASSYAAPGVTTFYNYGSLIQTS